MRILYDHQAFLQRYGGVSRYFTSIIKRFEIDNEIEPVLPYFYSDNAYYPYKRNIIKFNFKGKYKIYNLLNRNISIKYLRKNISLFHPTYFDPYFINDYHGPFVITIHDMIHDIFPTYLSDKKTANNIKFLAQKASKIITVSGNTKNDILKYIDNISENKIDVIYHSTDLKYTENSPPFYSNKPYLLYVGERHSYKNFIFFLLAIKDLLKKYDINLLCAGGPCLSNKEKKLLKDTEMNSKVLHIPIKSDTQLANLYHYAIAFCYPSLYEGFGIPILEAFACGCPAIISNTSCFPEIAGNNALYFNPKDSINIYETIEFLIKNTSIRTDLIQCGYNRVQQFSWEISSENTKRTYMSVI